MNKSMKDFVAVILDLDGVITRTATVHAQAWKQMFDEYLERRRQRGDQAVAPFDLEQDYTQYVDGKPRYDGAQSFLQARGLDLPYGAPEDDPDQETVCGLGNRKNRIFLDLLEAQGVEVFEDTVRMIRRWRAQGKKVAVVSSSKSCAKILQVAGLLDLFDARVDGVRSEELQLQGKPHPDIFLRAAAELRVEPARAVVLEDAVAGVQAGRAGRFGWVVGVARRGQDEALREHGAEVVVHNLEELQEGGGSP
jgi:trehalose 6-phosphate phosphatase